MNEKVVVVASVVCGVIFLLIGFYFFSALLTSREPDSSAVVLPTDEINDPTELFVLPGTNEPVVLKDNGTYLSAKKLLSAPNVVESDEDTFTIVETEPTQGDSYSIVYNQFDGSIFISLLSEPLATARMAAEQDLLKFSGFSESDLCSARVMVSTSHYVSEQFSGRNLGLSFCESNVSLE